MDEVKKYVCKVEDLDKLLPKGEDGHSGLWKEFRDLLSDNWRLNYKGNAPSDVFAQFGIDYDNPTVRDAVAFDLVKLDDDSVSNDSAYTYDERKNYSPMEYERFLLNKNFRINLVNLEPEWSNIQYGDEDEKPSNDGSEEDETIEAKPRKRTVDRVFQGIRVSKTLLDYFDEVIANYHRPQQEKRELYVPFTNANDFSAEVALIPNTHPDFRQITSRAYYDTKWAQYKRLLKKHGISAIATFALVDPKKDKNHTGEYLVKVQYGSPRYWTYLVVKMNKDGQILSEDVWESNNANPSILCVCEDDFYRDKPREAQRYAKREADDVWNPEELDDEGNPKYIRDIPMVHSTTSSHYSIFRQRIPDYDLKLVRHYLQFKNRLEGMELCLEQVKRDVHHKEVHSSECFSKLTMVLKRLMDEFADNEELMSWVTRFYDLYAEWDKLTIKKIQIRGVKDGKLELLHRLQTEYNALGNNALNKKLALGHKIGSLKLELDKSIEESLRAIDERLCEIADEMREINIRIKELQDRKPSEWKIPDDTLSRMSSDIDGKLGKMHSDMSKLIDGMRGNIEDKAANAQEDLVPDTSIITERRAVSPQKQTLPVVAKRSDNHLDDDRPALETLDTSRLHRLILQSERWRNYSFNVGYELAQFKKMLTMCEDATIKVRRLLHNFEERMKDTQSQVWDGGYNLRSDFDFKDITVAGLRDVILLHDWWAANAPGKTYEDIKDEHGELVFKDEDEFMAFRRRCNKVSYNLRKNQYAQLLAVKKDRTERRISELRDIIADKKTLHWDDKYGWDAPREDDEKWTLDKVDAKARQRIRLLVMAWDIIQEHEEEPRERMASPTKQTLRRRKVASFVDVELEPEDNTNRLIEPSKADIRKRKVSDFIDVELEPEDNSNRLIEPTKRQMTRRKLASGVVSADATYRECAKLERQYKEDSRKLVERTVNYLKSLGLIEDEADIERLATMNTSSQNPELSQRWLGEIENQRSSLDSAIELMRSHRKSMQSIIDNVAKMEDKIRELKQKNKRIYDICMKSGRKVKGVDRQVRNRMLMDKMENEQRIYELKKLVKKARSQHLEDFSALEGMRKDVDERQKAYDEKVRCFKSDIGLTQDTIDNLMVGIYNKFQDEILKATRKRK